MKKQIVKIGLIGCGFIAFNAHLPSIMNIPEARLIAVASKTKEHAKMAAERFGAKYWYTDYNELLKNPEVELVDICTPNFLHKEIAVAAAEAGKHIICIKPLARTLKEADEMVSAAKKAGVKLMYAENNLFVPALVRAKEIIDEGGIGELFRIRVSEGVSRPHANWFFDKEKTGGGCLIDMAVHSIAFTKWIANSEVERVYAELGTFVHKELKVEDNSILLMKFKNGVLGINEDSWSIMSGSDSRFEIFGSEGVILIDMVKSQPILVYSQKGYGYVAEKVQLSRGWTFPTPTADYKIYGHLDMMKYFINCVLKDEKPKFDGEFGRAILEIVHAGYESAKRGEVIKLPLRY